jgi:hypothetical protein
MRRFAALAVLAALAAGTARVHAQQVETLWNCKDKSGRTILTNQEADTKDKECRIVHQQRVTVVPASKAPPAPGKAAPGGPGAGPGASPGNFPKESPADRASAKAKQRDTLERELQQEEQLLAEARRKLAEQESIRTGDEKNYARVQERLRPYKDAVEVHEKNVDALRRELSRLGR